MKTMKLNWPKAFLLSAMVLCLALTIGSFAKPAVSQGRSAGYMVASDGGQFVWRVNTVTGEVSYCARRDNSLDAGYLASRPPFCSGQSPAVQ